MMTLSVTFTVRLTETNKQLWHPLLLFTQRKEKNGKEKERKEWRLSPIAPRSVGGGFEQKRKSATFHLL